MKMRQNPSSPMDRDPPVSVNVCPPPTVPPSGVSRVLQDPAVFSQTLAACPPAR